MAGVFALSFEPWSPMAPPKAGKPLNAEPLNGYVFVCPGCVLRFNEFDFLRIHKLLVNTNIDEPVKSQIYDDICRAKLKKCP